MPWLLAWWGTYRGGQIVVDTLELFLFTGLAKLRQVVHHELRKDGVVLTDQSQGARNVNLVAGKRKDAPHVVVAFGWEPPCRRQEGGEAVVV